MKKYDFAFSLGFACGTTQALRAAGLQFASYPLDWTMSPSVKASAEMVAADFANWLEAEDLKLVDVRHGPGFFTRIYRNERTGFGFSHEFSDFERFAVTYPKVKAMYARRIERFLERAGESKKILAVYMELPFRERIGDEAICEARQILAGRFPQAEIDLVYVYEEPGCGVPCVKSEGEGVTVVAADYRKFDGKEITHFVETGAIAKFLREAYRVEDTRKDEDKEKFVAAMKVNHANRWGKGRMRRRINKMAYKLYRWLEGVLEKKGLVEHEGPLWFVDRAAEKEGGAQ